MNDSTLERGTSDPAAGTFNHAGVVTQTTPSITGATGLTCDASGTWFLSSFTSGTGTSLYVGDITTGSFTHVGLRDPGIMIDISIRSMGNLYGHSISTNSLYSIDTTTGVATLLGPNGFTSFAQGMDFDGSTDTLYATPCTGGGTGAFASMDLSAGAADPIQSTTPLNAEMEIAFPVHLGVRFPGAAGDATWGPGPGAIGGGMAGDTRRFQGWYRDPPPGTRPCGQSFDLTNGWEITIR